MYVGITNNFDRRMREHQWEAFMRGSKLLVHKAIRKYEHTTEVWCSEIDDIELLHELEIQTIQQLRDGGYVLYNMTIGGEGVVGHAMSDETKERMSMTRSGVAKTEKHKKEISKSMVGKHSGNKNPKAKQKEYFALKETQRGGFKITCARMGWNFEDFIETDSGNKDGKIKKYYYTYKGV